MKTRTLGQHRVSAIGIGSMSFAGFYGSTTTEASHAVLAAAIDLGIDHIDTANVYGNGVSESAIGSFLAANPSARDHFRIATKAGIVHGADSRGFDNDPQHLETELDQSLARLGVDHVDLFYVHRRDPRHRIEAVTETLAGLIKKGKIGAFGYSEIAPASLERAAAVHPVAAVQSEYSLGVRYPELGLVQRCKTLGTALVAFSPVMRGMLTDTPPDAARAATAGFLKGNPRFNGENLQANLKRAAAFSALAADMGTTAAGLSVAWLLTRGDHVIPIPGTRTADHLRALAAGADLLLSADDIARIETVLPVGWAHGDRYSDRQWSGPEKYC